MRCSIRLWEVPPSPCLQQPRHGLYTSRFSQITPRGGPGFPTEPLGFQLADLASKRDPEPPPTCMPAGAVWIRMPANKIRLAESAGPDKTQWMAWKEGDEGGAFLFSAYRREGPRLSARRPTSCPTSCGTDPQASETSWSAPVVQWGNQR